jgi:hypothetical protein
MVFVDRSDRSNGLRDAFLAGMLSTLLGFSLAAGWDEYKYRRDITQRDDAVIEVLRQEVTENLELVRQNENMLADDVLFLEKSQTLVHPLALLKVGAWDLMRVSIPKRIVVDQSQLLKIEHMEQIADGINNLVRSRENFRISNPSASTLFPVISTYDKKLQEEIESFSKIAGEVKAELK